MQIFISMNLAMIWLKLAPGESLEKSFKITFLFSSKSCRNGGS